MYTLGGQRGKVVQGEPCPSVIDRTRSSLPPEYRSDLEVSQLRHGYVLAAQPRPGLIAIETVIRQRHHQNAGVNDDHGCPGRRSRHP